MVELLTGMRQGEILGATLDDLDLWRDKTLETPESGEIWIGTYTVNWKLESLDKEHGCGEPGRTEDTRAASNGLRAAPDTGGGCRTDTT